LELPKLFLLSSRFFNWKVGLWTIAENGFDQARKLHIVAAARGEAASTSTTLTRSSRDPEWQRQKKTPAASSVRLPIGGERLNLFFETDLKLAV
jgi:hypothetical protein